MKRFGTALRWAFDTCGWKLWGRVILMLWMIFCAVDLVSAFFDWIGMMAFGIYLIKIMLYGATFLLTVRCLCRGYREMIHFGIARRTALTAAAVCTFALPMVCEVCIVVILKLMRILLRAGFGEYIYLYSVNLTDGRLWYLSFVLILLLYAAGIIAASWVNRRGSDGLINFVSLVFLLGVGVYHLFTTLPEHCEPFAVVLLFILEHPPILIGLLIAILAVIFLVVARSLRSIYRTEV
ncbi:MAG: hypothetical protein IJ493_04665 [Clostridia bacterium]|nr:hypothetical protein [Clostridia bacterium]